ncbi:probable lysophospholipase BODYGUARD 3 [Gastrolobium bilobum]|uniref:probable lysophospholipase BODYGUARD 3 n=1 Tax=Gastrolobium bilobum TaxID=150636 RepID=UPI002AB0D7D1|nr:probable lysophospholipase BODYGUARD 3 [Gastrolobium bilobum]
MDVMGKTRSVLTLSGRVLNEALSFIVFCVLDLVDFLLCFLFKAVDLLIEAEWRPCYCSSTKDAITSCGEILVSEQGGESKIVSLSSTKLHLEDISDTLYSRPSLVSEVSRLTLNELKRFKLEDPILQSKRGSSHCSTTFTVNTPIVEMLQGKIGRQEVHPIPRWSDCHCKLCTCWISSSSSSSPTTNNSKNTLFVNAQGPSIDEAREDVLFIHGFISSSLFWTETLFPNFSSGAKSSYRLFAVDLLGFGKSPKPSESLYTLREHLEMIESSVLEAHKVNSFHIVAHSLGSILALALAVKHPHSVKSLTLLAPPFYPVPKGEAQATQYVMRRVAPRRVWPPMAFGASLVCWYEHITRMICLLICKNHRLWEFLAKLITRNRIRTFLLEGFFCHTHNAAWHTLHNIICGTAGKIGSYLDAVRENINCKVTIFHGKDDEVIPVECSYEVQRRIPRARVRIIDNKDHITIVVGRQKAFARELEQIWSSTNN